MPYIGNELATQFQAFVTQTITGDGSTGYTLDRAVANGKELLVYINNVKQEEGSGKAYTASGTTITFSDAVASTDSCYVVFLGSAVQTVNPPDASVGSTQLASGAVTSAKLDTNIAVSGTLGVTGAVTANGGAVFNEDSADVDFRVESDANTNALIVDGGHSTVGINTAAVSNRTLKIEGEGNTGAILSLNESTRGGLVEFSAGSGTELYVGSELGILGSGNNNELLIHTGVSALKIDRTGAVTKPAQPAFLAYATANTDFAINTLHTTAWGTEVYDQNNDFASNTFTAPVTGKYLFSYNMYFVDIPNDATYFEVFLVTSNRTFYSIIDPQSHDQTLSYYTINGSLLVNMDNNDTAVIKYRQNQGTTQTDVSTSSFFSGFLAC
jgi:hypothetical protein